jgi:hypothetical protein
MSSKIVKNHQQKEEPGLWAQLEKGANVYKHKPLDKWTEEEKKSFNKRMNEMNNRQMGATIVTTQKIVEEMTKLAAQDQESKIVEKLLEILSTLYIDNTITAKRYAQLEQLLLSDDKESQVLAGRIIKSLYKKEIVL